MKENQEVKLKGEIYKLVSIHFVQSPRETMSVYRTRLLDLTEELWKLAHKIALNVEPKK